MRKTAFFLLQILLPVAIYGQVQWNAAYQQYFNQYCDLAIEQMMKYKIPASITLAQGVFESGAGKSELAVRGNNHFGIKCNGWTGRRTYHDDDERNECFRAYDNVYESYEDHSKFLVGSQRYKRLFDLKVTDYKGWAHGLKACGYATNPRYATKLIEIIQLYKLYEYDKAKGYDKFMYERSKDHAVSATMHPIKEFNKNYYVVARRGDTFRSIADEVDLPYRALAHYNERDKNDTLEEGEIVWLKKKRSKAPKDYKGRLHYVKAGESMYSIAQKYGIRLEKLYRMNDLAPDYQIKVGEGLRLR